VSEAPVDVVYTWVDDRFEGYREMLRCYARSEHDLNPNRTRDNLDLLRFSLRSLTRHAPWIRRVYLLTARPQVPPWLDTGGDRLRLVHHDEIIDARHLPTFNSFAIISFLHRIPGLSPRFLYFEDDMLLGAPVTRDDFIRPDGRVVVYPRLRWSCAARHADSTTLSPWNTAQAFTNRLLDAAFRPERRREVNHVPLLVDREAWEEMERRWPRELEQTRASRFRARGNVAPEFLYPWLLLYTGRAQRLPPAVSCLRSVYHGLENWRAVNLWGFATIRLLRPRLIALNDNFGARPNEAAVAQARAFLAHRFPDASPFERQG